MKYEEIGKLDIPQIKEELVPYLAEKKQGEYTLEDYYALPDEHRVELIDGVIYDMTAPTSIHQILIHRISMHIGNYIDSKKGQCIVIMSPLDVQLDCDNRTMVQPDILVICDRSKFRNGRVYGAPDLIVEVLSPSTRMKDLGIKMKKYMEAGVREYWIVDPEKKRVHVYEFEKENPSIIYTFKDKVPVGIFDGECVVDFAEIYEYVRFLYEQ